MKDIKTPIYELAEEHLSFIRKHAISFPNECILSSQLLGSYLSQFDKEFSIHYGTFGHHNLFHAWVEKENYIVDLTLFQFLTKKEKQTFYDKLSDIELLEYALGKQGSFIITQKDEEYRFYKSAAKMEPIYTELLPNQKTTNYSTFLKLFEDDLENNLAKLNMQAVLLDSKQTFEEFLSANGLRLGKKFFNKFCIAKAIG